MLWEPIFKAYQSTVGVPVASGVGVTVPVASGVAEGVGVTVSVASGVAVGVTVSVGSALLFCSS